MTPLQLANETLELVIAPDNGASIVSLAMRRGDQWVPLMRPTPPEAVQKGDVSRMASFNLVPWSNRIVNARFSFEGQTYPLRANTPQGFTIHGDVRERPWRVVEQSASSATCAIDSRHFPDFNFPFPFIAEIRYALVDEVFSTTLTLTNVGEQAMPAGFGFHPYFNRGFGASDIDEAQLQVAVAGVYPPLPGMAAKPIKADNPMGLGDPWGLHPVPPDMDFSALTSVGARNIDHCFGGWNGYALIAYPSSGVRLVLECDPVFGHVIIYTPPGKPFFAVEPVTHANDAFNLFAAGQAGTGTQVLQPNEQLTGTFRISVLER